MSRVFKVMLHVNFTSDYAWLGIPRNDASADPNVCNIR